MPKNNPDYFVNEEGIVINKDAVEGFNTYFLNCNNTTCENLFVDDEIKQSEVSSMFLSACLPSDVGEIL